MKFVILFMVIRIFGELVEWKTYQMIIAHLVLLIIGVTADIVMDKKIHK